MNSLSLRAPAPPPARIAPISATPSPSRAGRRATRACVAAALAASVVAAHAWAAQRSGGSGTDADVVWSSVWLWLALVAIAGLAWGAWLSWSARHEQARLEARFRRDGAP